MKPAIDVKPLQHILKLQRWIPTLQVEFAIERDPDFQQVLRKRCKNVYGALQDVKPEDLPWVSPSHFTNPHFSSTQKQTNLTGCTTASYRFWSFAGASADCDFPLHRAVISWKRRRV